MDHTPEPWFVFEGKPCIGGPKGSIDADPAIPTAGIAMFGMRLRTEDEAHANAARAVACVNFCEGTHSDFLTGSNLGRMLTTSEAARLKTINNNLLAACEELIAAMTQLGKEHHREVASAILVVRKAKGD